ncbi:baseplate J/gp47 family protein [Entomomonas asaccharolytica]|uniref:Baseplate J/gp47 family protein n=1 Tax=Entomomonas asaccharolytica TaxID=2785331 RepID=A0A974NI30_9GAMM|nr:baseplate J/gp47 family protein [Entomomonas asaccharolytica]QQP86952.1 baseplate J/gp47 family protein [Entomomonas asaccharolytica]
MGQLTNQGYVKESLDQIITNLENGFKQIYGAEINIDPDSPDGQMIGIFAQAKADIEEIAYSIYKALDPNHASGAWLEQCADYAAITRKKANYSYLRNVILIGTAGALIPTGTMVSDSTKTRWVLQAPITLGVDGSGRGDFRSVEPGAYNPAEQQLKIETLILGLSTVTMLEPATIGEDEETDPQLRARLFVTRSKPAKNSADGTEANLRELAGVVDVTYLENITDYTDSNGLPPHSVNFIVDGGNEQAIAEIIYNRKPGGTNLLGDIEIEVIDGGGRKRKVWFDRPHVVYCALTLTVVRNEKFQQIDVDGIKQAINSYVFKIGEDVLLSRLFTPINTVAGFWVKDIKIGIQGETLGQQNIEIDARSRARFLIENIEVIIDEL